MILMSPFIGLGRSDEERADFLRKARTLDVKTATVSTPADWSDGDVQEARDFLDEHGMKAGEFSSFYGGRNLGSPNSADHREALEHYSRCLRHARLLGSHCVGFAIQLGYGTPRVWTDEVWQNCIRGVEELASVAEDTGVDISAHPHARIPLNSIERYKQLLDSVASPRLKILMDPVNLTWPQMFYKTTELVNDIFDELVEDIVALHAKDVVMSGGGKVVVHVDEAVPGEGTMDYATLLRRLDALDHDVTLYAEHFPFPQTVQGQQYIRSVAREVGVILS